MKKILGRREIQRESEKDGKKRQIKKKGAMEKRGRILKKQGIKERERDRVSERMRERD